MTVKNGASRLLTLQVFTFLAQALVGIFFPFFIGTLMDWDFWQIVLWYSCEMLLMGLLVYPVNRACSLFCSLKSRMALGIVANILFYTWLSIDWFSSIRVYGLSILFVLFLVLYWPNYHRYVLGVVDKSARGKFNAFFQMVLIGVNIIAPLISGYFWEIGLERYILPIVNLLFGIALLVLWKMPSVPGDLSPRRSFVQFFCSSVLNGRYRIGFWVDGIHTACMSIFWPIYFAKVVGSFALMGVITSLSAVIEVILSPVIGRWTDRVSSEKSMRIGIFSRVIDIGIRGTYVFFPTFWVVGGGQILAAILGPFFLIPLNTRMYQIIESFVGRELDFFVAREVIMGVSRFLFGLFITAIVYYGDPKHWWIIFVVAGVSVFGFWRWRK